MNDLTALQRDLLIVIAGIENPYGLALRDELEQYYETVVYHGRLYSNLDTLVNKGLVDKGQQDYRTNLYSLTHHGRRELRAHLDWENQYIRNVIEAQNSDT